MKKAVLATAILAAMVSGSSFAATVYDNDGTTLKLGGRVEGRFNISDDNKSPEKTTTTGTTTTTTKATGAFKDKSRARINLVGKTTLSDELYGFGKYESELDHSSDITNRYFFAGIGTTLGEFSYGKQDSAQVQITNFTDVMATFGADAADFVDGNKDKRDNNFLYSGTFDALTVQMNYVASDTEDNNSYGISGVYNINDNINVGLGYVKQEDGSSTSGDQFNVGGQFKLDAFTLGALYTTGTAINNSDKEVDADGYEVSAQYKLGKTSLAGVYNYQEIDNQDSVDEYAAEVIYKFNGNLRVYSGYLFQQIAKKDDQLQAGIRYDF